MHTQGRKKKYFVISREEGEFYVGSNFVDHLTKYTIMIFLKEGKLLLYAITQELLPSSQNKDNQGKGKISYHRGTYNLYRGKDE
jgi:hypothetical protein